MTELRVGSRIFNPGIAQTVCPDARTPQAHRKPLLESPLKVVVRLGATNLT